MAYTSVEKRRGKPKERTEKGLFPSLNLVRARIRCIFIICHITQLQLRRDWCHMDERMRWVGQLGSEESGFYIP